MHYCLQVPELVSNIFQYCRANDEAVYRRSPRLKSLPALAQTCQFFLAPALDAHWHTIPSLEPLLNLLPQDVVELRTGRYSSKPLLYVKPSIQRRDFSRWMYYSPRVKAIDTSYYALPFSILEIDNSVYDVLLSVSDSGDPLLPNIQDITTGIRFIHTSLTLLNLLFNQHVRRIMVIDSSDDEADFDDELPWAELAAIIKHRNVGEGVIDVTINLRFFAENTSIHSPRPLTQQILNYSRLRKLDLRSFWLPDAAMVA
ncbi:unnamed protein product [Cyclocybe aegerita]|uniref:F-box domain-containing protein n=1 Tax=Cyclocybe aegerita TaxID=1973307 RepID=A0A8S0WUW1_CYCAE|nr:unnamed protein product [Cyclocybe aegerita]